MQKITSVAVLKNAIQLLETEQDAKGQLLKDQFSRTCESLKPVNLLTNTLNKTFSTSNLADSLSGTSLGVAGGLLLRKLFVGSSRNILRKLVGSFLQFGVSNFIAQNPDMLKAIGHSIIQHLFGKREVHSKRHVRERNE